MEFSVYPQVRRICSWRHAGSEFSTDDGHAAGLYARAVISVEIRDAEEGGAQSIHCVDNFKALLLIVDIHCLSMDWSCFLRNSEIRRGLGFGHDFWLLLILMYEKIHEKCLFFEQLTDAVNELPEKRAIRRVCRLISLFNPGPAALWSCLYLCPVLPNRNACVIHAAGGCS